MPDVVVGRLGRMSSSRDVSAVLHEGRRRSGARLAMHVRAAVPPVAGRLAVIASRRVGNAPVRNRAKRLMREAAVRVPWHHGIDVVLVARPPITEATMWDVQDELVELAGRLGVAEPQGLPS